jgi:hypothetical protein
MGGNGISRGSGPATELEDWASAASAHNPMEIVATKTFKMLNRLVCRRFIIHRIVRRQNGNGNAGILVSGKSNRGFEAGVAGWLAVNWSKFCNPAESPASVPVQFKPTN